MEILRDPVIFLPVRNGRVPQILDFATLSSSGVYVGNYLGQTVDQVRADYPDAQLGECDDVIATKEAMLKTAPVEIAEDQYIEMLGVLPPLDFRRGGGDSSFKMCEMLSGRITSIFAVVRNKCYTFNDLVTLSHEEIVAKVLEKANLDAANPVRKGALQRTCGLTL